MSAARPLGGSLLFAKPIDGPALQVLPPAEPRLFYSTIPPENISAARDGIRTVMGDLKRLSRSINAWAADDSFGEPNQADLAIEGLTLVLEKLT